MGATGERGDLFAVLSKRSWSWMTAKCEIQHERQRCSQGRHLFVFPPYHTLATILPMTTDQIRPIPKESDKTYYALWRSPIQAKSGIKYQVFVLPDLEIISLPPSTNIYLLVPLPILSPQRIGLTPTCLSAGIPAIYKQLKSDCLVFQERVRYLSSNDHHTSPGIITIPLQAMAPSKPLQDDTTSLANIANNAVKKYGPSQKHQQQPYVPITSSPLNPRSSSGGSRARPATLPRRHTVSGPAPSAEPPERKGVPTPVVPRPVRHTRRHSGSSSSVSPTERLMRYKGALAWRSANLRRQNAPEGPGPHSDTNGGNDRNTMKDPEDTTPACTLSTTEKEKADYHVVFQNQHEARGRRQDHRPQSPLSYHPAGEYYHPYCATTRPRAIFRRHPRENQAGMYYGCSSSSAGTTTLQRAGFVAVAFLFGIYMTLHAFSLVIGRGIITGTGSPNSNDNSLLRAPTGRNASWDMPQAYR